MGILNHLFRSTESKATQIKLDEDLILKSVEEYHDTLSHKQNLMEKLPNSFGQRRKWVIEFKSLLNLELAAIHLDKKEEHDLIINLLSLEHTQRIQRVHKLQACLGYVETKHEYVYSLLGHLYVTLISQARLAKKLLSTSNLRKYRKIISDFHNEFEVELALYDKITQIQTFHNLFVALVNGEHVIHSMDVSQKKLLRRMQAGMNKVFSKELRSGITYEWAIEVYNAVQDVVTDQEAILAQGLDPHQDVHFEFVNRPDFVELVRATLQRVKGKQYSDQMITVFVHIFREWYNHGRD